MDAPLAQCTREEQRAVVRFLWSEGSSGTKLLCQKVYREQNRREQDCATSSMVMRRLAKIIC